MKRLNVKIENCYGIRSLKTAFDFSGGKPYAIYAPNGGMKTSFARTFSDIAEDRESGDKIFPDRQSTREIVDENATPLSAGAVLVIKPYDESFGDASTAADLLVDAGLRDEYARLNVETNKKKAALVSALKKQSGSKRNLEEEISLAFTKTDREFLKALLGLQGELSRSAESPFSTVEYDRAFEAKALEFLRTEDFRTAIEGYVKRYNELLAASSFFKKGTFNYFNADTVAKSLASNGFFDAKHTVVMNGVEAVVVASMDELKSLIETERLAIAEDPALRQKFQEIERSLNKNAELRAFRDYLANNEELLPEFANVEGFKKKVWMSYLAVHRDLYFALVDQYNASEVRKLEIESLAAQQRTQWERVIDIFNRRFFVPFKLVVENRTAVILGQEPSLSLSFEFDDGEVNPVRKPTLIDALSSGEKKAFYLLNVIFEIEARKKAHQETVLVVDDIADSFDYKNKYAIIQYLKEISEETIFHLIVLTHNFDFFRTIESRFVPYDNCRMAFKSGEGIVLEKAAGIRNVFMNEWKPQFFEQPKARIAAIPFMRNLVEYTRSADDQDYVRLSSLLHWRKDSQGLIQADLDSIYASLFNEKGRWVNVPEPVVDFIFREADECLTAPEGINFENKIVLSIAIRLRAESLMANRIADPEFVDGIESNQTTRLLTKFREVCKSDEQAIEVLQCVILMTPENIHLNAFMYEPIVDMSDAHLRDLYRHVVELTK